MAIEMAHRKTAIYQTSKVDEIIIAVFFSEYAIHSHLFIIEEDNYATVVFRMSPITTFFAFQLGDTTFLCNMTHFITLKTRSSIARIMMMISQAVHTAHWLLLLGTMFDTMSHFATAITFGKSYFILLFVSFKISCSSTFFEILLFRFVEDVLFRIFFALIDGIANPLLKIQITDIIGEITTLYSVCYEFMQMLILIRVNTICFNKFKAIFKRIILLIASTSRQLLRHFSPISEKDTRSSL